MTSYSAVNERIKRQYFAYLAKAQGHSEQTIDAVAKAISRFEAYTRYKDFKTFHIEQALSSAILVTNGATKPATCSARQRFMPP